MPGAIAREDGHLVLLYRISDFSDGGLGIKINGQAQVLEGQKVNLLLKTRAAGICLSNAGGARNRQ